MRKKKKGRYGEAVTVDSGMLRRIEPFCRYGGDFRREVRGAGRIKMIEDYAIHLCNENGSALIRVCPLVHKIECNGLRHWMENLFTHVEFGGFVKGYREVL